MNMPPPSRNWFHDPNHIWLVSGLLFIGTLVLVGAVYAFDALEHWLEAVSSIAVRHYVSPFYCTAALVVTVIIAVVSLRQFKARLKQDQLVITLPRGEPLIAFKSIDVPRPVFTLSDQDAKRLTLITGRPGSGKTTLMTEIGRAFMEIARDSAHPVHTVTFDAHRDVAARVAWWSEHYGRDTVVLDLGNPEVVTPIQFPRHEQGGAASACESIQEAWFPFEAEVPTQMEDALFNVFTLLIAGGYGLEQSVRLLRSSAFRDDLLAKLTSRESIHVRSWVALIADLPPNEWYRKFWSSLARLFTLLEHQPARIAVASRPDGFSFERLVDSGYRGPGLDVIVTAHTRLNDKEIYFLFGLLLNELGSVLRQGLVSTGTRPPDLVLLADELGRYGAPGALLDVMTTARNVKLRAVCACHSLMSLHPQLRDQVTVLAANRIAGAETGPGAQLAAEQLVPYEATAVATIRPDGQPTYWSKMDQLAEFLRKLQTAPDHVFAVKLVSQPETIWSQPVLANTAFISEAEAAAALERAARRSGRPVAEIASELERENNDLDRRYGRVAYQVRDQLQPTDDNWQHRPDSDFAPW